ncbi:ChbG/HpnK family deacetylase [candidate division KSB1 bacterium]|nr:ChbG/HpnK family deacetylase [candidate division KSB1 bacterium]
MEYSRLIINADDFGLTGPINRGIIETIENGIVNSVSLIATGTELDSACDYLRFKKNLFKGWHMNLTTGRPVLDPQKVGTLTDRNGFFLGKTRFILNVGAGLVDADECRKELLAQRDQLLENNIRITHVDSHHDIHCLRFIANIIKPVLKDLNYRYIRFHKSQIKFLRNFGPLSLIDKILIRQSVKRLLYQNQKNLIDFIWFRELYQYKNKLKVLKSYISGMRGGVHLVLCHPGYYDESNKLKLKYNKQRQEEMKVLCNPDILLFLKQHHIKLIFNNDN